MKIILRKTILPFILILYLSGFILPFYLNDFFQDNLYINLFIVAYPIYLILGVIGYYYLNGTKRRKTKNIKSILSQDLIDSKKSFIQFIILAGATGAIILSFVLFGWLIASLSATTIIIILLILILIK